MAAYQLQAPLPFLTLEAGATVTVEAIDPNTGAAVSGVTVSEFTIYAANSVPGGQLQQLPPVLSFDQLV